MSSVDQNLIEQLEKYKGYLDVDPDNAGIICQVADLYVRLQDLASAKTVLADALSRSPLNNQLLFNMSNIAIAQSDFDYAIDVLETMISQGVEAPAIRYNLAYALAFKADYSGARDQLLLISDARELPQTYLLLGKMYHFLGDMEKAIESINSYLAIKPGDTEAIGVLSLMYIDDEDMERAFALAKDALAVDPMQQEALLSAGTVSIAHNDIAEARDLFEKAITVKQSSGRAWAGKGLTSMLALDLEGAISDLKKAVEYMPEHIGTWHTLAWCYLVSKDYETAKACFERTLKIDDRFGETYGGLAVISILQQDFEHTEELIKKSIRLNPASFSGHFARSLYQQHRGNTEEAGKIVEKIFLSLNSLEGTDFSGLLKKVISKNVSKIQ